MLKSKFSFSLCLFFATLFASYTAYFFLLNDHFLHISIKSIISCAHDLAIKKHLLVLGFLPIYIAAMMFGSILLGIYFGSRLENLLTRRNK